MSESPKTSVSSSILTKHLALVKVHEIIKEVPKIEYQVPCGGSGAAFFTWLVGLWLKMDNLYGFFKKHVLMFDH